MNAMLNLSALYVLRRVHRWLLNASFPGAADFAAGVDKLMARFEG